MEFWIAWVITGLALVGISVFRILPALMLKACGAAFPVRDRVVEKREGAFGEELVCEPSVSVRPYFSSYRIARDEKGVYFEGEMRERRAFLDYEIAAYTAAGELIDVLRVKEKFIEGKTHMTRLPKRTDFTAVTMLCADDNPMPRERRAFGRQLGMWIGALSLAVAATVDLFLWVALTFLLRLSDDFTGQADLSADVWVLFLILTGLFAAILTAAWSFVRFIRMRKRDEGNGKREKGVEKDTDKDAEADNAETNVEKDVEVEKDAEIDNVEMNVETDVETGEEADG